MNWKNLNLIISIPMCTCNKFIELYTVFTQHKNNSCKSTTG